MQLGLKFAINNHFYQFKKNYFSSVFLRLILSDFFPFGKEKEKDKIQKFLSINPTLPPALTLTLTLTLPPAQTLSQP
jgi:hypothetical protein